MKPKSVLKSIQQRARQKSGETTETRVESLLRLRGYSMVEKINVSFGVSRATGKQFAKKKVSGDFRAVRTHQYVENGELMNVAISVLVECKHHAGSLPYSAFRPHQIEALAEHARLGGISIVAWDNGKDIKLIHWFELHAIGFGPHKSVRFYDGQLAITKRGTE